MYKVLVTGATGFIGSHLARKLLLDGLNGETVKLYCLVRNAQKLSLDLAGKAEVLCGSLSDSSKYRSLFSEMDCVFHLAAEVHFFKGEDLVGNNVEGTKSLIDSLKGSKVKRIIFASSVGAVDRQPNDDCLKPLTEDADPNPLSEYGRTKLDGERIVIDSGLEYAIARLSWTFGTEMTLDTHIRALFEMVRDGKIVTKVAFPGRVSFISVHDAVKALCILAVHPKAKNGIVNVTRKEPIVLGTLFRTMGDILGVKAGFIPVPAAIARFFALSRKYWPLTIQNLFCDVLWASNEKLRSLGFVERDDIVEGLQNLAHWSSRAFNPSIGSKMCVITGAASGIGRALALQLHAHGKKLFLIDKNGEALVQLASSLNAKHKVVDLMDEEQTRELMCDFQGIEFDQLVNCAGVGLRAEMTELDSDQYSNLIKLNVISVVKLSHFALGRFRQQKGGVLVNISSSAALQPLPYMATYSASKAFILNFTEALLQENREYPKLKILAICPAGTRTNFQESAGVKTNFGERLMSSFQVARAIRTAMESKNGTVYIGWRVHLNSVLTRLLPRGLNARLWNLLMKNLR